MPGIRSILIWAGLAVTIVLPMAVAATSPYLASRDAIYIAAGYAGMGAMALLLVQPLLAAGLLPGLPARGGRRVHQWVGGALVLLVVAHVAGLWATSPPDVIDALLFDSPTPFSFWGVVGMWAVFAAALMAALRGRFRIPPRAWRIGHTCLAVVIVLTSVIHAWLVEGTMGTVSKAAFCLLVIVVTGKVVLDLRASRNPARRQGC